MLLVEYPRFLTFSYISTINLLMKSLFEIVPFADDAFLKRPLAMHKQIIFKLLETFLYDYQ